MSELGNARANLLAIRKETDGSLVEINDATQFIPLRSGFNLERTVEELANEELRSGIGEVRGAQGKETVTGSYQVYLKHSGVEGQAPEYGVLLESAFGEQTVNGTEFSLQAASTTSILKVADGTNFYVGQALLIKDSTNGFSIRNIDSIDTNDLILNFPLDNAPASGVALGKAVTYIPKADGFATFSAWQYLGNGHSLVVNNRNEATSVGIEITPNEFANMTIDFEGQNYRLNPIIIGADNKFLDLTDDDGTIAVSVAEQVYNNPIELATALQTAINAATTETITVTYSNETGKFTIASDTSTVLELLWNTGTNAANSIGETLGFAVAANDTGATTYTSDNEQTYEASFTPSYDDSDPLVGKDIEFYIGDEVNMMCRCATTASITITKESEDVDCICEETGTKGKIATQRLVEITSEIILDKHDVSLFKALKDNDSLKVMLVAGEKQGGNYQAGSCFNFFIPDAGVTSFATAGENFIIASVTVKGYINGTNDQCYINYL